MTESSGEHTSRNRKRRRPGPILAKVLGCKIPTEITLKAERTAMGTTVTIEITIGLAVTEYLHCYVTVTPGRAGSVQ
jgi:hypothetical protein